MFPASGQPGVKIGTVVIDAGHGGKDPGTVGRRTREKYVALAIALKLGTLIQRNIRDVKVIYTRDKDQFIELFERAAIANQNQADLFISVHANANHDRSLRGAETYIMGLHKSTANLEIAKLENAAILLESDYAANYCGFDPNSDESYITFSLHQNSNLELSSQFAAAVQDQMKDRVGLNDRGVRQAGFLVLYKTTMPSVLIEVGYLSNTSEENFLISDKGQEYIASAIYRAFRDFRNQVENPGLVPSPPAKTDPKPPVKTIRKEVVFRIQLAATPDDIGTNSPRFKGLTGVQMYRHGGMFKYTVGEETDLADATRLQGQMQKMGFRDAFIVAFRNGERISLEEAKTLLNR